MNPRDQSTPEDHQLMDQLTSFDPSEAQITKMELSILHEFEAEHSSLFLEWIDLFRFNPVGNLSLSLVTAVMLLLFTPIGNVLMLLLRQ